MQNDGFKGMYYNDCVFDNFVENLSMAIFLNYRRIHAKARDEWVFRQP